MVNAARFVTLLACILAWCSIVRAQTTPEVLELLDKAPIKDELERLWGGNDVKFVVRLEDGTKGGLKAIFRPEHQVDEWKHRKEIAAYRLARLCGIDNVPATVARSFPESMFRHAGEQTLARLTFRDGMLEGALQVFVKGAHDPLGEAGRTWARERLVALSEPGQPDPLDVGEARQFTRLIVFDYLQSNSDRFSGGNLLQDKDGTYWFIDNADAYYSCKRTRDRLDKLSRFDRGQVDALRSLTREQLSAELRPLLGPKQVGRVWKRVQRVLMHVDALLARHGDEHVLF